MTKDIPKNVLMVVDDAVLEAITEDWSLPPNIVAETFNTVLWNKDYSHVAAVIIIGPDPMERERAATMAGAITGIVPAENDPLVESLIATDAERKIMRVAEKVGLWSRMPDNPLEVSVYGDYCPKELGPVKTYDAWPGAK